MKLAFSARAERNLEQIALWIARDDPRRAESYTAELRAVCARIADHPLAFPAVENPRGRALHKRAYGAYLIIYEVTPRTVRITAILHGARNRSHLI